MFDVYEFNSSIFKKTTTTDAKDKLTETLHTLHTPKHQISDTSITNVSSRSTGGLSISGLAAFAPVLAALSADNVTPLAMVQMENLGSLFHINGKYAIQVPDLLQRCKSTRLDRLGLLVGWRKGDSASLMAQSAGGQAISLLSMCISNLYGSEGDIGLLFVDLSKKMLSQKIAISSPLQLVQVANTLSSKLEVLGFGNIIAAQVARIHDAYEHLGKSLSRNFLDKIAPRDMAELLYAMTRAVREESIVVRITGSRSMGHILAIVTIMFPEDAFVTMENVIVFAGLRKSILVEFMDSDGITNVQVESKLQVQSAVPIIPISERTPSGVGVEHAYCYRWTGCMADMLQVMFMDEGLICPEPLRVACYGMLEPLAKALTFTSTNNHSVKTSLRGNHGMMKLLGPYPHERIDQICQKLWRIPPGWAKPASSLKSAFDILVLAFAEAMPTASCTCEPKMECFPEFVWRDHNNQSKLRSCLLFRLWGAVGETISRGFGCLFVNAGDGATIVQPKFTFLPSVPQLISELLDPKHTKHSKLSCGYNTIIHMCIMSFCGSTTGVGASSNSSTVYMTALQTPQLPNTMNTQFMLMEGQLIFNGRYHRSLQAFGSPRPDLADKNIHQGAQPIIPSSIGEHSGLLMTILEGIECLELKSTIVIGGEIVHLYIGNIILASWGVHEAEPCEHPANTPLEPRYKKAILTTSVASPSAIEGKISIVQVSRNVVAQLFSCVENTRTLLQKNCCLNCAYEEAVKGEYRMIIVE